MITLAPTGFEPMFAGPKPAVLGHYTMGLLINIAPNGLKWY